MAIRIAYAAALLASLAVFLWTGAPLAAGACLALLVLAALMLAGVLVTRAATNVTISMPSSFAVGDAASIEFTLVGGPPFPLALLAFDVTCKSLTFESTESRRAHAAIGSVGRRSMVIPVDSSRFGRMRITLDDCTCQDALGLFRMRLPFAAAGEAIVYPRHMSLVVGVSQMPLSRAFGETYDTTRSGSDVDEVFDVREFQKGDHLASVHWKLSSKFDELMSREFSRPVDFELVVVCLNARADQAGDKLPLDVVNGTAAAAHAISADLLNQGYQHNFAAPANDALMNVTVDGMESTDATAELLLGAPIAADYADAFACVAAANLDADFTKCILVTPVYDEQLFSQLAHDMDLTVVLVEEGVSASAQEGDFDVVTVDVGEASAHERYIAL